LQSLIHVHRCQTKEMLRNSVGFGMTPSSVFPLLNVNWARQSTDLFDSGVKVGTK